MNPVIEPIFDRCTKSFKDKLITYVVSSYRTRL
uniref:Transposase n=2 Tax=unclassified bacterial viruses TaxID=12333 RepID=A0AAU8KWW8_9VIRU